jgi:enterobactin synthetase component D
MAAKAHLGHDLLDIPVAEDGRAPSWPSNVVGSITHSRHLVAAAISDTKLLIGLGIDLEEKDRVKIELAKNILSVQDLKIAPGLSERELLTLIFSAKESLYKALYPLVKKYFGFDKAAVTKIDLENKVFIIELLDVLSADFNPKKRFRFAGKFAFLNQHILTVLEIPLL